MCACVYIFKYFIFKLYYGIIKHHIKDLYTYISESVTKTFGYL